MFLLCKELIWTTEKKPNQNTKQTQKSTEPQPLFHKPVVTSTSTGRIINSVLSEAFVFILMKAVWLSASLEEKLALITPFVS